MDLNQETAKVILEAAHASWNAGNIERVLINYVDDLVYVTNTGPDGTTLTIRGKEEFRARFGPVMASVDAKTSIDYFHFEGGVARVGLSAVVRHRQSGHELTGSFRQVVHFRGFKICQLEDYHDAAKMTAFWRLVEMSLVELDH